jgi:hypothetical protein
MITPLTATDLPLLRDLQQTMLEEAGLRAQQIDDWCERAARQYRQAYATGTCMHFAEWADDNVVAVVGAWIQEERPFLSLQTKRHGFIIDEYVKHGYCGLGLETQLRDQALAWLASNQAPLATVMPPNAARLACCGNWSLR